MKNYILMLTTLLFVACGSSSSSSSSSSSTSVSVTGKAGSMARFAISGDYLYTVNSDVMNILDVSESSKPKKMSKVHIPFDVETIFAYKDYLYVGASSGVYIYDKSTQIAPTQVANFTHAQACDPVVVADDIAYITLNSASTCWNNREGINRLEILDVRVPTAPKLITTVDMWEPKGLGVDANSLFICDGSNGLRVYDINKTMDVNSSVIDVSITLKDNKSEINCFDVIAYNKNLVVSSDESIQQFNYSSFPMKELGKIK